MTTLRDLEATIAHERVRPRVAVEAQLVVVGPYAAAPRAAGGDNPVYGRLEARADHDEGVSASEPIGLRRRLEDGGRPTQPLDSMGESAARRRPPWIPKGEPGAVEARIAMGIGHHDYFIAITTLPRA